MAAIDVNKAYPVGGKLSYGCDDLDAAYPHGGTALGLTGSMYFQPPMGAIRLPAEENNGTNAVLYTGGDAVFGASLVQWDNDAIAAVFPNTSTVSTKKVMDFPGSTVPVGGTLSALSPLVFTPTNSEMPAVIIYKAIPLLEESARLALSSYRFMTFPVLFVGIPDATDRVAKMAETLTGLTL